jgi:acyl-coenzyme A synthetase/AMP-(fatty) acid ligase
LQHFSPYTALHEHASRKPDADAIVTEDATVTYGEFAERVVVSASWLLHQGLIQGEVTGICIRGEIEHLVCAMALLCLDTPHMSLGSHENAATKRALARKVSVTQLVVEKPDDWMGDLRTIVAAPRDPKTVFTAPRATASSVFRGHTLDSIAVYQNTSGSTSVPKTFGFTIGRLLFLAGRYAKDPKERRTLRTGSIEFDAHRLNRIGSLLAGNTCIFLRDLSLQRLAAVCERARVSIIHLGAYKLASLVHAERHTSARLPPYTGIMSGGSRVPGRLRQAVKALLTDQLWVHYATSEAGTISLASPDQHEAYPEGVGFLEAGVTVEIVGPDGEGLDPGEIGQIRVFKPTMASGYLAEPGASSSFRDGWFYPRDLVSRATDEPLIFHGRADDVMILNGINIFPSAIEDTLESHPDVQEAVAFSVKSRIHGEIPVAAIVLSANAQNCDTSHLLDHCRRSLGVRGPRQIRVVESIPRNQAGKPLRRELASF